MSRELDININVQDSDAKSTLGGVDQALDSTTAKAQSLASGVWSLEGQLASARTTVNNYEAAFKQLGVSLDAPNRMLDTARARVAALESQLGTGGGAAKKFGQELKDTSNSGDQFIGMVDRILERMAIYASARAVIGAIESTIEWGVQLERMSEQTGFSVEAIQQLNFAAIQTAVPLDRITAAITQMQRKMEVEDGGFIGALGRLHIGFDALRAMAPEQQFDVITNAISQVKNQTEFAGDAAALFNSRSGASIAAVIKDWQHLKAEADDANIILGTEQVKAIADVEKAWEKAKLKAEAYLATILAGPVHDVEQKGAVGAAMGWAGNLAYGMANVMAPGLPGLVSTGIDYASAAFGGAQAPGGPNTPPGTLPSAGQARNAQIDPNRARQLSEIATIEKEITEAVRDQESAEKEQAAFEKEMYTQRLQVNKEITKEINAQVAAMAKATDQLVQQNLAARVRNNAALGLDAQGRPQRGDDPFKTYSDTMHDISTQSAGAPGVNVSDLQAEAERKFQEDVLGAAKAADAMAIGANDAAASAMSLSRAHTGAVQASDMLTASMMKFSGMAFPTTSSDYSNIPQTTLGGAWTNTNPALNAGRAPITPRHFAEGGYAPSAMHAIVGDSPGGEYMVPAAQMQALTSGRGGGGVSVGDIHIHGNVDSELRARQVADRAAQQIWAKLGPLFKTQLTKK